MRYPGMKFAIGGEELIIPAVSLGQLRHGLLDKLRQHDDLIAESKIFEALNIRGEVILAAIRRNYPDYSEEKLLDHLDMVNTGPIWLAILGASGLGVGESQAAMTTELPPPGAKPNGTFAPSTEVSPQPTDGPIGR